jgi:hypothetical protein
MDGLEALQVAAVKKLLDFFNGPSAVHESPKAVKVANLAVSSLSAVGRIKATDRARDATQVAVLKGMATDQKQFEKYIRVSMPHLCPSEQIE